MPPLNPAPKALARLISHRNIFRQQRCRNFNHSQIRCLSTITATNVSSSSSSHKLGYCRNSSTNNNLIFQKRGFLGCSDGGEGNILSRVYEERRVLGYSPEQLFDVVAAVDLYEDFVPWCQRSEIMRHNPDGSFHAELEIGFKFLVESYVSHVELNKPKSIKTTSSQSSLFDL